MQMLVCLEWKRYGEEERMSKEGLLVCLYLQHAMQELVVRTCEAAHAVRSLY